MRKISICGPLDFIEHSIGKNRRKRKRNKNKVEFTFKIFVALLFCSGSIWFLSSTVLFKLWISCYVVVVAIVIHTIIILIMCNFYWYYNMSKSNAMTTNLNTGASTMVTNYKLNQLHSNWITWTRIFYGLVD